jgi:mRNA interferase MazF
MKRGEIVRVDLPPPAGAPGREQIGQRPAIVVQDDSETENLPTTIVVPLTSNLSAMRFAGSILIKRSPHNGLDLDSVALTAQVRAIDRKRIGRARIGHIDPDDLTILETQLKRLLGL